MGTSERLGPGTRLSASIGEYRVGTSERLGTRLTASGNERASGDET